MRFDSGFELIVAHLADLILDTPDAPEVVGKFLARGIADGIVSPGFIEQDLSDAGPESALVRRAFTKARGLVGGKQGLDRLARVWGMHGCRSPVVALQAKVMELLQEYVVTNDAAEATRCIRELRAPQFHHEVVFQAVSMATDGRKSEQVVALSQLLHSLCRMVIITPTQVNKGLDRVLAALADTQLDVPRATTNLDAFCRISTGVVPQGYSIFVAQLARTAQVSPWIGSFCSLIVKSRCKCLESLILLTHWCVCSACNFMDAADDAQP